jgi:hypothetical protein
MADVGVIDSRERRGLAAETLRCPGLRNRPAIVHLDRTALAFELNKVDKTACPFAEVALDFTKWSVVSGVERPGEVSIGGISHMLLQGYPRAGVDAR